MCIGMQFQSIFTQSDVINTVQHKNFQLNLYLDKIQYNSEEKIGLLPYILENPNGTYLEIGTGGDPISSLLEKIPSNKDTKVIAADIDKEILQSLPIRHPSLKKYIDAQNGPKLILEELNATNLYIFNNESLDGINASAIIHEIISYAGGFDGLNKFLLEALRTLKPNGILAYRDPEFISNKYEHVKVNLKNKYIRLFAHIFLYTFLDKTCSQLAQKNIKLNVYESNSLQFTIYKKSDKNPSILNYESYLNTPTEDIDFSRPYSIHMPYGLYKELARHYLTYLHTCNPLLFIHFYPKKDSESYGLEYFAHSTENIFLNFLFLQNISLDNNTIESKTKKIIDLAIEKNVYALERGIKLTFSCANTIQNLEKLLESYHFNTDVYLTKINTTSCKIDYRIFSLLFEKIEKLGNMNDIVSDQNDIIHAQWLKREGEEFYFYYNTDELITHTLDLCYKNSIEKHVENIFVLCPIYTKIIHRLCYTSLLKNALEVFTDDGYEKNINDGKQLIHFQKMPLNECISYYEKLIKENEAEYPCLKKWLDTHKEYIWMKC
jgi:hypothetical protein